MEEFPNKIPHTYSINSKDKSAVSSFYHSFNLCFSNTLPDNTNNIVLLCIGSDRSTGDCLGPLVGHRLQKHKYNNIHIIGTLEEPAHAKNLQERMDRIKNDIPNPFVIAIDACLGKFGSIGYINLGPGPLRPGAGVNKVLPWVGDMHIKGIVNTGGFMEHAILQSTRLNQVMKLTDIIVAGLHRHFILMSTYYDFNNVSPINQFNKC